MSSLEVSATDLLNSPYRYVGLAIAYTAEGTVRQGVFTLVGRNDLLTATHLVIDEAGRPAQRIDFFLGVDLNREGGTYRGSGGNLPGTLEFQPHPVFTWTPAGGSVLAYPEGMYQATSPNTLTHEEAQYDFAILGIDRAIGDELGWLGMNPSADSVSTALSIGYPALATGMMYREVSPTRAWDAQLFRSSGGDLRPGDSGGPLIAGSAVVGVASGGSDWESLWSALGWRFDELGAEIYRNDTLLGESPATATEHDFTRAANETAQWLQGFAENDRLAGGGGNDTLAGFGGNDSLHGDAGDDVLQGGAGDDVLTGGAGNDVLYGGNAQGDSGLDKVSYADALAGLALDLSAKKPLVRALLNGADTGVGVDTLSGIEGAIGSMFADRLTGSNSANYLAGAEGNDLLTGKGGNDTLDGGAGIDTLKGGAGADVFVLSALPAAGEGPDLLLDFRKGIDRIALSAETFTLPEGVSLTVASEVLYLSGRELMFDADGAGAEAAVALLRVTAKLAGIADLGLMLV